MTKFNEQIDRACYTAAMVAATILYVSGVSNTYMGSHSEAYAVLQH